MASIIIPAHNEASVIGRALKAVVAQAKVEDEIIVCANGCTDATEEIARAFAPRVTVLSTATASKVQALNMGDAAAKSFPRLYVDADVELMSGCLERIERALESESCLAVAPEPVMDMDQSSWAVKAYYRIWLALPYCQKGMIGAGTYALSEQGRARFDVFPDLIADDGFVRALFQENERGRSEGARVRVRAPADLRSLLKMKIRSRVGQMQLAATFPELIQNEVKAYTKGASRILINPFAWPAALLYLAVTLVTKIEGKTRLQDLSAFRWEKDASSRGEPSQKQVRHSGA